MRGGKKKSVSGEIWEPGYSSANEMEEAMGPREQSHSMLFNQPRSDEAETLDLAILPQASVASTPTQRDVCEAAFPAVPLALGRWPGQPSPGILSPPSPCLSHVAEGITLVVFVTV